MRVAFLGVLLASVGLTACDPAVLQPQDEYVAVVGRSSISVPPNQAEFDVAIRAVSDTLELAKNDVAEKTNKLIDALLTYGVSPEDLSTDDFAVRPNFQDVEVDGNYVEQQVGFEAYYQLSVRTESLSELGALVDLIVEQAYNIEDFEYTVKDKSSLFQQTRENAIADARTKAEQYARAAGRALGAAIVVEESDTNRYRLRPSNLRRGFDEITVTASKRESKAFRVPFAPPNVSVSLAIYAKYRLD